jgi:hypothetical protein
MRRLWGGVPVVALMVLSACVHAVGGLPTGRQHHWFTCSHGALSVRCVVLAVTVIAC